MVSGWTKDNDMLRLHTPCETPSVGTDAAPQNSLSVLFFPSLQAKSKRVCFLGRQQAKFTFRIFFFMFHTYPHPIHTHTFPVTGT